MAAHPVTSARHQPRSSQPAASSPPAMTAPEHGSRSPTRRRRTGRKGDTPSHPGPPAPPTSDMAALANQLAALTRQMESLHSELCALRAENASLHQQLATARGVHQHQPYAPLLSSSSPRAVAPPQFAHTPPRPGTLVDTPTEDSTMTDASPSAPTSVGARRALSLGPHEAHVF